jgi:LysR family glycine cleavage system transcriptional activator
MANKRRLIPSTSMLMAFDAAARTGSFTAAARELHLTQGAVSRQVGALESQLGVELFERIKKTVKLTEAGKIYAGDIHEALQTIRNASISAMSSSLSAVLNLAILPTIGTRWLMPRLPLFLKDHPDVTVNFVTKLAPFDFQSEDLHSAIHYGLPNWPDTSSMFLMGEEAVPVCSRSFLEQHPISKPEDMADATLLHLATRPGAWANWLTSNGEAAPEELGMHFENFLIVTQAAIAGLGAALLPKFLIQSEIDRGELEVIFDLPLESEEGYYLVTPIDKSDYAPVVAFREWLTKMVE